jgi:putative endonuclease
MGFLGKNKPGTVATANHADSGPAVRRKTVRWPICRRQACVCWQRNYRTPGRGGGEIDLVMREPDGTVVFVEVRSALQQRPGGAAASIGRPSSGALCLRHSTS